MSISSSEKINGSWNSGSKHAQPRFDGQEEMAKSTAKIYFRPNLPNFAWGLNHLDIDHRANARVKTSIGRIKSDSFEVSVGTWADSTLYGAGVTYLDIYDYDRELQHGSFDTNELHISSSPHAQKQNSKRFEFNHPFSAPPAVIVWLTGFDVDKVCDIRIRAYATDITSSGFTCHIDSWGDTILYWASAHWVAHPADSPRISSGVYSTNGDNVGPYVPPQPVPRITSSSRKASTSTTHVKHTATTAPKIKLGDGSLSSRGSIVFPEGKFTSTPRVSAGINMINFSAQANARVSIVEDNVSPEGFDWGLNTWGDSRMKAAGAAYIAIDEGPGSMLQKTKKSTRSSRWEDSTNCSRSERDRRSDISMEDRSSTAATVTAVTPTPPVSAVAAGKQRSNSTRSHSKKDSSGANNNAGLKPRPTRQSQRYSEETKSASYLPLSSPNYIENLSRASLPASVQRSSSQHNRDPSIPRSLVGGGANLAVFPPSTSPTFGKRRKKSTEEQTARIEDVLLGISSNDLLSHQLSSPAGRSDSGLHKMRTRSHSMLRPSQDDTERRQETTWKSSWKLRMKRKKPVFHLHST